MNIDHIKSQGKIQFRARCTARSLAGPGRRCQDFSRKPQHRNERRNPTGDYAGFDGRVMQTMLGFHEHGGVKFRYELVDGEDRAALGE